MRKHFTASKKNYKQKSFNCGVIFIKLEPYFFNNFWSVTMIGYVTLGTNNFDAAAQFYDALLAEINAKRFMDMDTFIAWASSPKEPSLAITKPFNKEAASAGNGSMVDSHEKVDSMYAKAIELGASDEGKPGLRGGTFYAGYFRDLDGNKLNIFTM